MMRSETAKQHSGRTSLALWKIQRKLRTVKEVSPKHIVKFKLTNSFI